MTRISDDALRVAILAKNQTTGARSTLAIRMAIGRYSRAKRSTFLAELNEITASATQ